MVNAYYVKSTRNSDVFEHYSGKTIALRNVAKFWWPRILAGNQLNCNGFAHFGGKTTVGCNGYRVLWREIAEKQQFAHYVGK